MRRWDWRMVMNVTAVTLRTMLYMDLVRMLGVYVTTRVVEIETIYVVETGLYLSIISVS